MAEARLTIVNSEMEAEVVCGLLRSEGIDCYFLSTDQGAGSAGGVSRGFGAMEIVVRTEDLERARELLDAGDSDRD